MTWRAAELEYKGVSAEAVGYRRWRRAHGLTIKQLAYLIAYSARHVASIERGEYPVTEGVRAAMATLARTWRENLRPAPKPRKPGSGLWKRQQRLAGL